MGTNVGAVYFAHCLSAALFFVNTFLRSEKNAGTGEKSIVQDKSIHLFNCSLCLPGYLDTCLSLSFNPAPTKNQKEKEKNI